MNLDTATPTGRLMLNVLGSVAQFEREVMLERQRAGIAKAKGEGKYKGRAPTLALSSPRSYDLTLPVDPARQSPSNSTSVWRASTGQSHPISVNCSPKRQPDGR